MKIIERNIEFDFKPYQKKYWFNDDPLLTTFANAITLSIPYGEQFMIVCVLPFVNKLKKNKTLKKELIQFIRQESNHSREHHRFASQMVDPYYSKLNYHNFKSYKFSFMFSFLLGKKLRLAMVAAAEHLTAMTGELFLIESEIFADSDNPLLTLWQWHFVEEVEHKAVAFDLLKEMKCGYIMRMTGFFIVTIFITCGFLSPFLRMVFQDKLYKQKKFFPQVYHLMFGKVGLFKRLAKLHMRYLKPGFYPHANPCPTFKQKWLAFEQKIANVDPKLHRSVSSLP